MVEWSRPPKNLPISESDKLVELRTFLTAILRALEILAVRLCETISEYETPLSCATSLIIFETKA